MRIRAIILLAMVLMGSTLRAQALREKNLLIMLGAGAGPVVLTSDRDSIISSDRFCGVVDLGFSYALSPRFSLGIHYQRQGSHEVGTMPERLHLTRYEIEAAYRLKITDRSAWEATGGLGVAGLALSNTDDRLPAECLTSQLSFGVRYVRLWSEVVGSYALLGWSPGNIGALSRGDVALTDAAGERLYARWSAAWLGIGMLARF